MTIEKSLIKRIGIYLVLGIILYSLDYSGEEFGGLILFIGAIIFATLFYIATELVHESSNKNPNYNRLKIWGIVSIFFGLFQLTSIYLYRLSYATNTIKYTVNFILNFFNEFIESFYISTSNNIFTLLFPIFGFIVFVLAKKQKKSAKYFFVFLKVALIFSMINFYLITSQEVRVTRENNIKQNLNHVVDSLDASKCRNDQGYSIDECKRQIAIKTQDAELCPKNESQVPCITRIAIETKNYETCLKLKIENDSEPNNNELNFTVKSQFDCLIGVASKTHEEKICNIIKESKIKYKKDHDYFIATCENTIHGIIPESYLSDDLIKLKAGWSRDINQCSAIYDLNIKYDCMLFIAIELKVNSCENMSNPNAISWLKRCYIHFGYIYEAERFDLTEDSDNDGLYDLAEVDIYNLDPFKKDSDNDGINDKDEVLSGKSTIMRPDTFSH